ncbi:MAG: HAD family hydrolase [Candidatus Omnitrophica bacterium]|nr:HAD family hydrolase [Candidatus Omnitrophota bacterium]
MAKKKVVFIDRDGVINHDLIGDYIKHWGEFSFMPGVLEALKELTDSGFEIIIVSNQAGIGDGVYTKEALDDITSKMLAEIKLYGSRIHSVLYCLHGKSAGCDCRKPKTGLFHQAAAKINFNKSNTFFIGDKLSDIQAGRDFGLKTILVLTGYGERENKRLEETGVHPDYVVKNLGEAVVIVKGQANK